MKHYNGALWAGGYFRFGRRLAEWLSWQYAWSPEMRRKKLQQLETFANAFRDINRRVCVDTYVSFHFTRKFGDSDHICSYVSPDLACALATVHAAQRAGRELSDADKQQVFLVHFLDEQKRVVGPAIEKAVADLDWPLVRFIALKPWIRFAYFSRGEQLWFANFADREERIENGLRAFTAAANAGWTSVEHALGYYGKLPTEYFTDPARFFVDFRTALLATG